MFKRCFFGMGFFILSIILIFLLSYSAFAFAEEKESLIFGNEYFAELVSSNQSNQNGSATISLTDTSDSQLQSLDLRPAHKYLGFATAAMAGITAASFSSEDFHKIAGIRRSDYLC